MTRAVRVAPPAARTARHGAWAARVPHRDRSVPVGSGRPPRGGRHRYLPYSGR
ncbi:hypothetical protein [Streptomyces shenzhenensis]|uniref:hypothetical protein n=1 Tax=Streptomyces shenzhenensis TaxID=943815 RepID=UPI001F39B23D|nr:hypothetical protein [Streptomyces shenzhenensis]